MDLSSEDALRLNVMLANAVAVRIDEGAMLVRCLAADGNEARVPLNPNCKPEQYIRRVRELLSSNVLGSPGGYPVFLKRWTRMGQGSDMRLADLLMLGEPEAVVAVSGAPALTDDLARRAWWAMPDAENARRMLARPCVVQGSMGPELAAFLLEFLPFEQEPYAIIESVRLVLQPGLIDEDQKMAIWQRGRQKNVFLVGFLKALPDHLPEPYPARTGIDDIDESVARDNPFARQLRRLFSSAGQTYLQILRRVLSKPANQDMVVALMETIGEYFQSVRLFDREYCDVQTLATEVAQLMDGERPYDGSQAEALQAARQGLDQWHAELRAMLTLAHVGEPLVRPIFARTDSVGSVMRRKIEPVAKPILEQIKILLGA